MHVSESSSAYLQIRRRRHAHTHPQKLGLLLRLGFTWLNASAMVDPVSACFAALGVFGGDYVVMGLRNAIRDYPNGVGVADVSAVDGRHRAIGYPAGFAGPAGCGHREIGGTCVELRARELRASPLNCAQSN